ncbi:hypothetical protein Avbf_14796 [Armadillidium vulgare]|nr:hypothetical protein Avbf_14796 [Armadillidium vulgare]
MDIKSEIDIKNEPLEVNEDYNINEKLFVKDLGFRKIQKSNINTNSEIKNNIKEESLFILQNRNPFEQSSGLGKSELVFINELNRSNIVKVELRRLPFTTFLYFNPHY